MKKYCLSYDLSILARDKGFNEPCNAYHRKLLGSGEPLFHVVGSDNKLIVNSELGENKYDMVAAPLYHQMLIWLLEEHRLNAIPDLHLINVFEGDTYRWLLEKEIKMSLELL